MADLTNTVGVMRSIHVPDAPLSLQRERRELIETVEEAKTAMDQRFDVEYPRKNIEYDDQRYHQFNKLASTYGNEYLH